MKLCWHCGHKLIRGIYAKYVQKEDGHSHIVHKACKKDLEKPVEQQMIVDANFRYDEDGVEIN